MQLDALPLMLKLTEQPGTGQAMAMAAAVVKQSLMSNPDEGTSAKRCLRCQLAAD